MQACFQFILPTAESNVLSLEDFMSGIPRLYENQFKVPVARKSRSGSNGGASSMNRGIVTSPSTESKFSDEAMELEKLILAEKKRTVVRNMHSPIQE
jgi:hypothetical protein